MERAFERFLTEEESFGHFVVPNQFYSLLSAKISEGLFHHLSILLAWEALNM